MEIGSIATRAGAGVVRAAETALVVRIVGLLIDLTDQVAARVDRLQIADCAIDRPSGAFVVVLVIGRSECLNLISTQRRTGRIRGSIGVDTAGSVVPIAVRFHVLIVLL